jgi:hypothetical protein
MVIINLIVYLKNAILNCILNKKYELLLDYNIIRNHLIMERALMKAGATPLFVSQELDPSDKYIFLYKVASAAYMRNKIHFGIKPCENTIKLFIRLSHYTEVNRIKILLSFDGKYRTFCVIRLFRNSNDFKSIFKFLSDISSLEHPVWSKIYERGISRIRELFSQKCKRGDLNGVKEFVEFGIDVNYEIKLLEDACIYNHVNIVAYLLNNGAVISTNLLIIAYRHSCARIVYLLLKRIGFTVIHLHIKYVNTYKDIETVRLLVECGAKMSRYNLYSPGVNTLISHDTKIIDKLDNYLTEYKVPRVIVGLIGEYICDPSMMVDSAYKESAGFLERIPTITGSSTARMTGIKDSMYAMSYSPTLGSFMNYPRRIYRDINYIAAGLSVNYEFRQ